ncbi:9-cis-epoxycarotenoid dioxygenase [Asimina triloba]
MSSCSTATSVQTCSFKGSKLNLELIQSRAVVVELDSIEESIIFGVLECQRPLPKIIDPIVQIFGNFAPVDEHPVEHDLPIMGRIPLASVVLTHHLFDGDGMVHCIRLRNGSANYAYRYNETSRLTQEHRLGRPMFLKAINKLHDHSCIARLLFFARNTFGLVDSNCGIDIANTDLVYFNRRLLTMSEDDLLYQVRITASSGLDIVGCHDFNDQLNSAMTTHAKIDPISCDLSVVDYDVIHERYIKYFCFALDDAKSLNVKISVEQPTMMHNFTITENLVVIPNQQANKTSRFRNVANASGIRWADVPDCFRFHLWNGWEEPCTDEAIIIGSCMTPTDTIFNKCEKSLKIILSEI